MKKCIDHYKDDVFIVIRKSITDILDGDAVASALCSYFERWHNYKLDGLDKDKHENSVAQLHGDEIKPLSLFQFHTVTEIEDCIQIAKKDTIRNSLKKIIALGIVSIHDNPNPKFKFDKTKYYLFHPNKLQKLISAYANAENRISDFTGVSGYEEPEHVGTVDIRKIDTDYKNDTILSAENRTSMAKNSNSMAKNRTSYTDNTTEKTSDKEKKEKDFSFKTSHSQFDSRESKNQYLNDIDFFIDEKPDEISYFYDIEFFRELIPNKRSKPYKGAHPKFQGITLNFLSENELQKWTYEKLINYFNTAPECILYKSYSDIVKIVYGTVYDREQEEDLRKYNSGEDEPV